jgi:hypothetical protein
MRTIPSRFLVPILLSLLVVSCSKKSSPYHSVEPLAARQVIEDGKPDVTGAREFYPLKLGNHWTFERHFTAVFVEDDGTIAPIIDAHTGIESELVCEETIGGLSYIVEHDVETFESEVFDNWVRMRQDAAGLYEADVATSIPASCDTRPSRSGSPQRISDDTEARILERLAAAASNPAELVALQSAWDQVRERYVALHGVVGPGVGLLGGKAGGVQSGEITRLDYPLHTGQTWVVRDDPDYSSTDEGADVLHTPVGTISARRIRIDSEFFGPGDRVIFWFGRHEGFVGLNAHTEFIVTDGNGDPIGKVVSDDVVRLVGIDLVGAGRF